MKSIKIFVTILLLISGMLKIENAQANALDSLLRVSEMEKNPEIKSDKYLYYISKMGKFGNDSVIKLLDAVILKYQKTNLKYGLGRALSLKAWYLVFYSKYEESFKIGHQALAIQKSISDSFGIADTYNRLGVSHMQFKRFKDAEKYFILSNSLFNQLRDTTKIDMTLNNLGVLAFEEGKNFKAIGFYKQSLAIRKAQKKYFWVGYSLYNIGATFLKADMPDSSEYYLMAARKTIIEQAKKKVPTMITMGIAELYRHQEKYDDALSFAQEALAAAEKANHKELILQGKHLLSEIYSNLNRFKEAFNMQTEYVELKNSIDSSNNAANVAEIEERYQNAEKEVEITKLKAQKLTAENKAQSLRIYTVSAIAIAVLIMALTFILWQYRNQKEKIKVSNLNTKIAEAKMFALRAQMNPHFIFNCINTAQSFVMQNQREQANEYLANFAKLLRLVLDNSSKTFVQLEDEINQLKLYLDLEAIRFEQKFNYEIEIEEELEQGIYEIPGMCIQPLIENAIGHGLINRNDDKGKLKVTLKLDKDCIVCEITDNGVGREKAAGIKAAKTIHYQSAALPNIKERLEMLNAETAQEVKLQTIDLMEDGHSAGTKVILTLPWK